FAGKAPAQQQVRRRFFGHCPRTASREERSTRLNEGVHGQLRRPCVENCSPNLFRLSPRRVVSPRTKQRNGNSHWVGPRRTGERFSPCRTPRPICPDATTSRSLN